MTRLSTPVLVTCLGLVTSMFLAVPAAMATPVRTGRAAAAHKYTLSLHDALPI